MRRRRHMRHSQSEKLEIIRVVEDSALGVKRTLRELDINRNTFYEWYRHSLERGVEGLADNTSCRRQFWNAIPPWVKKKVVETALKHLDKSPRELAWHLTDTQGYFISESSVYRILKANDLITSPAYTVLSAKDKFDQPTTRVNQLWQTDFTYLKIIHWGWYYLSTVMDDYSRYILSWRLCSGMSAKTALGQWAVPHIRRAKEVPGGSGVHTHPGRNRTSHDSGKDRAVSPFYEDHPTVG